MNAKISIRTRPQRRRGTEKCMGPSWLSLCLGAFENVEHPPSLVRWANRSGSPRPTVLAGSTARFAAGLLLGLLSMTPVAVADSNALLAQPSTSILKIRPQAVVVGDVVALLDVLSFDDADSTLTDQISSKSLSVDAKPPAKIQVAREQIEQRLAELGVNRARVLLTGASVCEISLEQVEPATEPSAESNSDSLINPAKARNATDGDQTLADVIKARIVEDLSQLGGTPEIEFEAASREFLELTTPPFQFSVRSARPAALGLREMLVTLSRDGRVQRTLRIGAHVKLSKPVLVATKPLNVGSYVTRDSVELTPRIFTSNDDFGLQHPEPVIGQQVKSFVPASQMLRSKDIQAVDLVKRSKPVTVEGGGSVSIRVNGVALDNGGYGEVVRVRLGDNKKNRREVRGVVTGVATVRLSEEG